jgi:hypothetical protein
MNLAKLSMRHLCDTFELPHIFAIEDRLGIAIGETPNHEIKYCMDRVVCEASNAAQIAALCLEA